MPLLHESQGAAGREIQEKLCRRDVGSTLQEAPLDSFEIHDP